MSHHKVKSIVIKDNKVLITGKCNNDTEPVKQWHCTSLTKILNEEGLEKLEIEILKAYEEGQFQSSSSIDNKYTRALKALYRLPGYRYYNWRNSDYKKDCPIQEARRTPDFETILKIALNTKIAKAKIIISKDYLGQTAYLSAKKRNHVEWSINRLNAKVFSYIEDAKNLCLNFTNSDQWKIEVI